LIKSRAAAFSGDHGANDIDLGKFDLRHQRHERRAWSIPATANPTQICPKTDASAMLSC
jgi:hypothetical protein